MADTNPPLLPSFTNYNPPPTSFLPSFTNYIPPPNTNTNTNGDDSAAVPLLPSISQPLDRALRRLHTFLCFLGLSPFSLSSSSSSNTLLIPSSIFFLFGVALPTLSSVLSQCSPTDSAECQQVRVDSFEICVLISESAVAAVAIGCVSRSLCKYGNISKFLFMEERCWETNSRFQKEYLTRIQGFFRLATWCIIPSLIVKITREGFRFVPLLDESTWRAVVVLIASIVSWTYLTSLFLASCSLFHLVCLLQVIHFEDYAKLLEQDRDPMMYLEEHMNLRYDLLRISHRFRMFLLLIFSLVTIILFVVLFITTAYGGKINFTNAGDIALSSIVQTVGLGICLHGAAKITHRAQNIAPLAARWHALATCSSSNNDSSTNSTHRVASTGNLVSLFPASFVTMDFADSDLESLDNVPVQNHAQLASYMSSYHKREALILYLLANPGGITIFGWVIDRGLLNTIVMFEVTLILFVFSKTIVLPTSNSLVHSVLGLF